MLSALRSEPIREPEEVFLVDRVQHRYHCPLDDLVLKCSDSKRALSTIWLRYIPSSRWQCPICSPLDSRMQIHEPGLEVCLVVLPCQPVYAGAAFRFSSKNASRRRSTLMWWRSEVNRSFFLCLAACRMRSSASDTLSRFCARHVVCWPTFPLAPALRSIDSAANCSALFTDFPATTAEF